MKVQMVLGTRCRHNLTEGNLHSDRITRLQAGLVKIAGAEKDSVGKHLPVDCKEREIREVILVCNGYQPPGKVSRFESHILVNLPDLGERRVWRAVRSDQPVTAEIAVAGCSHLSIIAAVSEILLALLAGLQHPLVNPVPDKPALQNSILLDHIPVILEVAGAVTH